MAVGPIPVVPIPTVAVVPIAVVPMPVAVIADLRDHAVRLMNWRRGQCLCRRCDGRIMTASTVSLLSIE